MKSIRTIGWVGVVAGLACQATAYTVAIVVASDAKAVGWLTIAGIAATLAGTMILGAARAGRLTTTVLVAVVCLFLIPVLGFGGALLLPPESLGDALIFGLPRRAALVLVGVGLLQVAVFPLAYLLDGADQGLTPERIDRLLIQCRDAMAGEN